MSSPDVVLREAATATFESMALLFATSELEADQRAVPVSSGVVVTFRGPRCGRLELRVSPALLPLITSNMLGEDGPQGSTAEQDALGELANIICGNALPALTGSGAAFDLAAPRALESVPPLTADARARAELWLEYGRAEMSLYLDPELPG